MNIWYPLLKVGMVRVLVNFNPGHMFCMRVITSMNVSGLTHLHIRRLLPAPTGHERVCDPREIRKPRDLTYNNGEALRL